MSLESASSVIRGRSHPRRAGPLIAAHDSASFELNNSIQTCVSASGIIRGRSHPRRAEPLIAAHDATHFRPKKSPLYHREMNSEKVWNSLVNGNNTSSNSTENRCNASISVYSTNRW